MFSPLFTGRLLRLAAALPEDKAVFASWSRDDDYLRNLDDDPIRPLAESSFGSFDAPIGPDNQYFHLRTLADDTLIGFATLHSISWTNQVSMLAIGIGLPEYRGRGYGQDALWLILNYAFNELNLHRVGLTVMAYNAPAIKAYERAGFVPEGARREAVQREGARHDLLFYGILRREWVAKQAGQVG